MPAEQNSTPNRRATHVAAQEKAKTEALFASIGEGIIATNARGKITRVNKAALDILAYRQTDLLGQWFPGSIVAAYDNGQLIEAVDRPIAKAFLTGRTIHARISYQRKDGSFVPVALTVSPILLENKPIGAIEIFRDLTLEIRDDEMKTEFISVASHQLRTPLSSIHVYSRMLYDGYAGAVNASQKNFLRTILSSVDRMNHLISTLLNITRIEAGGVRVDPKAVKLQALVRETLAEITPHTKEKGITLKHSIDSALPSISTDPLLVREAYTNLLSNAIKYTPSGGTITVTLRNETNDILFKISDTGYGIPAAAQKHIFTKFFRASNITSQDVSGTGLGLYLTKTIVESLDGELWFDSTENVGTTFYFSLPKHGSMDKKGKFKLEAA